MLTEGHRVWRLTGMVSTDDIIPARHKHRTAAPAELAPHVFEFARPGLAGDLLAGDALVGDATFGIGSSREQAVEALLASGVRVVLAPSFGRIFFRNAWNLGLVALEVVDPPWPEGERISVDLAAGTVVGPSGSRAFAP
ncbi:MAG TPA: hypothetical protein VFT95_04130, partial [Micromonosporaceae bacterium]|nr:hypothetical protein [Micromonosporaceae bacterium]